jgi:hypothetical protein
MVGRKTREYPLKPSLSTEIIPPSKDSNIIAPVDAIETCEGVDI